MSPLRWFTRHADRRAAEAEAREVQHLAVIEELKAKVTALTPQGGDRVAELADRVIELGVQLSDHERQLRAKERKLATTDRALQTALARVDEAMRGREQAEGDAG